eukprot:g20613.t1
MEGGVTIITKMEGGVTIISKMEVKNTVNTHSVPGTSKQWLQTLNKEQITVKKDDLLMPQISPGAVRDLKGWRGLWVYRTPVTGVGWHARKVEQGKVALFAAISRDVSKRPGDRERDGFREDGSRPIMCRNVVTRRQAVCTWRGTAVQWVVSAKGRFPGGWGLGAFCPVVGRMHMHLGECWSCAGCGGGGVVSSGVGPSVMIAGFALTPKYTQVGIRPAQSKLLVHLMFPVSMLAPKVYSLCKGRAGFLFATKLKLLPPPATQMSSPMLLRELSKKCSERGQALSNKDVQTVKSFEEAWKVSFVELDRRSQAASQLSEATPSGTLLGQDVAIVSRPRHIFLPGQKRAADANSLNRQAKRYFSGSCVCQDDKKAVEVYQRLADLGDADAQFNLGVCYEHGKGVGQDYTKAVQFYQRAADQGNASAQTSLGVCYGLGRGVGQDYKEAVEHYQRAVDQGHLDGQFYLGLYYKNGLGVSKDFKKGVELWKHAADQGNAKAQCSLAELYVSGRGVSKDYKKAAELYQCAADQGDVYALFNLGQCYEQGIGVDQSHEKAVEFWQRAADQGDVYAQYNLGVQYGFGRGVAQDYKKAVELWKLAARQGNINAVFNMGVSWEHGQGVAQDYTKAAELYQGLANLGHYNAQFNLGKLYEHGRGVAQDYTKAAELYEPVADLGCPNAQFNLGVLYEHGRGVFRDYKKAVKLYQRSADQGNTDAQNNLGACYERGIGVDQDHKKAMEFYQRAADQGHARAKENLRRLDQGCDLVLDSYEQQVALVFMSHKASNRLDLQTRSRNDSFGHQTDHLFKMFLMFVLLSFHVLPSVFETRFQGVGLSTYLYFYRICFVQLSSLPCTNMLMHSYTSTKGMTSHITTTESSGDAPVTGSYLQKHCEAIVHCDHPTFYLVTSSQVAVPQFVA